MDFPDVPASAYSLVDLETGSTVGAAASRDELKEILLEEDRDALRRLLVIGLDAQGRPIGDWHADDLVELV
jgi:hypothetical protein